ncbi:MAG: hypothetical protein HRT54_22580 [Colwellia sp.]|nr:hypothetical protein [Colwellia sp.]
MNNNVLHQPANTVLDNTKAMVDKEGIEEITSNYSYQFKKTKLDKLSLVNTANNTGGITKSSMAENIDLNNYLSQLEEKIIRSDLLPIEDRKRFEKLSNLPMCSESEFESIFEFLLALQMKKVGLPYRYGVKTTYKNEKEQDTYIDFEIFTHEGPTYIVLTDFYNDNYFSCSNLARYRRPRIAVKQALDIKTSHECAIYMLNIDKTLKSFYLDVNQLIWEFDSFADVLTFDECIDAMNSIIDTATKNAVH